MRITVDDAGAGMRLDRFLAARFAELSRATIMKYLKEGGARCNGSKARPGQQLAAGDDIALPGFDEAVARIRAGKAAGLPEVPRQKSAPSREFTVLYSDDDIVVVNKAPGLVMHPGTGHENRGLDVLLRREFGQATRLVHRIDKDTSGVVVAARGHPVSARRITEAFREGDVEKRYLALVRGVPATREGSFDAPLLDSRRAGARVLADPTGKAARTDYEVVETFAGFAWVAAMPRTGRRHQIRVHFASGGHPLAVDAVYGQRRRLRVRDLRPDLPVTWKNPIVLTRQPLHAEQLTLRHPRTGEERTFCAPLPRDLEQVLELLRADAD